MAKCNRIFDARKFLLCISANEWDEGNPMDLACILLCRSPYIKVSCNGGIQTKSSVTICLWRNMKMCTTCIIRHFQVIFENYAGWF